MLIDSATEQTTAATDLIISAPAVVAYAYLGFHGPGGLRGRLWRGVLLVIAITFFGHAVLDPENFLPFIVYELTAMIVSLAGFAWITIRGNLPGAAWITAAIAVNIAAAAIQAEGSAGFTLVWQFDHNGTFHLVQMVAIGFLVKELRETERE